MLAKHSEILNAVSSEADKSGYKNIKDYLQDATLDSIRREDEVDERNMVGRSVGIRGSNTVIEN